MPWRGRMAGTPASRERVAGVATTLLTIRSAEGLAAWVLFNELLSVEAWGGWTVPAAFVVYLLANLLVVLRYRARRLTWSLAIGDVAANVLPLSIPIAASGAAASPLLLLLPLKAAHYAIVFGSRLATVFLAAAAVAVVAGEVAMQTGSLPLVSPGALGLETLESVLRVTLIGFAILATGTTVWLRRVWARSEPAPPAPAAERSDREAGFAYFADTLLSLGEAVSGSMSLEEILETVVEIAPHSLGVDYCGIALWEEETGRYTGVVGAGVGPTIDRRFAGVHLAPEEIPDFEWVRRLRDCVVVSSTQSSHAASLDVPAVLIAPLLSRDQFFGVIEFARRASRRSFTQRDLIMARGIARQTAVALERARLTEHGRRLIRAIESTEDAVLITDARRRIRFANPAFLRTFGYRSEELLGKDAIEVGAMPSDRLAELQEKMQRHRGWREEAVVHRKDGTPIPIMLTASLIRDDDGKVQGAVAIVQDVTAEKIFQEQMQRADRLAAVGETAAGMAHEINNALAVILGQTSDAGERPEAALRDALARVEGQARRIADIVQGVLGFARPRPPRQEPCDLTAVTTKTIELLRHDLERQRVRLETAFHPDLPPAEVDPQQIQQVLLNLCRNALQAMSETEDAWLRIEVLGIDDRLAVRVTDGGPGIDAETIERIFDPFFSTKSEGSGLGLSVSYAIARAHGGDLLVRSEPGRGATFTLLLPIARPSAEERVERVLLVDDDPEVAEALAEMLTQEGLHVSRAATGEEALRSAASGSWDAVFLDVRLPDLSGPDVFERLREQDPELAKRVVFVTGGLWRSESRLRHQLPPQPTLAKPCTQDQVRDVLRRLRSQRRQAA